MSKYFTIGLSVLIVIILTALLVFNIIQMKNLESKVDSLSVEVLSNSKNLTDSLIRSESHIVDNIAKVKTSLDINAIREDIKVLDGRIIALSKQKTSTPGGKATNTGSTTSTPDSSLPPLVDGQLIDVHQHTKFVRHQVVRDDNKMRVADVSFRASQEDPWSYVVHPLNIQTETAHVRTKNNEIVLYSETSISSNAEPDKIFKLPGKEFTISQIRERPQFKILDPRIFLGLSTGINLYPLQSPSVGASTYVSLMSYGNDWNFIQAGIGYDFLRKSLSIQFVPFQYNIGEPIPFLNDIFLGPYVSIDHRSNVGFGFTLNTRL